MLYIIRLHLPDFLGARMQEGAHGGARTQDAERDLGSWQCHAAFIKTEQQRAFTHSSEYDRR